MTAIILVAALAVAPAPAPAGPCARCHEAQASQWKGSLHALASSDPLVLAMRRWAREDAGEAAAAPCVNCHTAAVAGTAERTSAVTCPVCHQGRRAKPGPAGWMVDPEAPVTGAKDLQKAPHPMRVDPGFAGSSSCLVCHAELRNPAGVPLCTTGPESEAYGGEATCLTCHMPDASHRFPGATEELLARAATLDVERDGGRVAVTVANTGAGHALPTGSALRQIRLEVRFLDASGAVLWTNAADEAAVFARVLRDAAGNAPVPPWRAVAVASDSRLAAGEQTTVAYTIPDGAVTVRARLVYRRVPAPVATRLGVANDPLARPVEMASVTQTL